jgi:hypothetical protein
MDLISSCPRRDRAAIVLGQAQARRLVYVTWICCMLNELVSRIE